MRVLVPVHRAERGPPNPTTPFQAALRTERRLGEMPAHRHVRNGNWVDANGLKADDRWREIQGFFYRQCSSHPRPGVPEKPLAPASQAGIEPIELLRRV
jgi:hypothetical protein